MRFWKKWKSSYNFSSGKGIIFKFKLIVSPLIHYWTVLVEDCRGFAFMNPLLWRWKKLNYLPEGVLYKLTAKLSPASLSRAVAGGNGGRFASPTAALTSVDDLFLSPNTPPCPLLWATNSLFGVSASPFAAITAASPPLPFPPLHAAAGPLPPSDSADWVLDTGALPPPRPPLLCAIVPTLALRNRKSFPRNVVRAGTASSWRQRASPPRPTWFVVVTQMSLLFRTNTLSAEALFEKKKSHSRWNEYNEDSNVKTLEETRDLVSTGPRLHVIQRDLRRCRPFPMSRIDYGCGDGEKVGELRGDIGAIQ